MVKRILLTIIVALLIQTATSQKLVIGSKTPVFKDVEWKTAAPGGGKAVLVEFYQSSNHTSESLYSKLADIHSKYSNNVDIVVLTRENNAMIDRLIDSDGQKYSFAYDPDGKTYEAFGVKFVPFTMLIDSKGSMLWQGNLSNITGQVLQKAK